MFSNYYFSGKYFAKRFFPTAIGVVLAIWNYRKNTDTSGWTKRSVDNAPVIVGSGAGSFAIWPQQSFVFWRPRFLNFGTIVGGFVSWDKRLKGSTSWATR